MRAEGGGAALNVTFNVTTQDADSFRRSEGQIAAMLTALWRAGSGIREPASEFAWPLSRHPRFG